MLNQAQHDMSRMEKWKVWKVENSKRHPELDSGAVGLEEEFPFITADAESSSA